MYLSARGLPKGNQTCALCFQRFLRNEDGATAIEYDLIGRRYLSRDHHGRAGPRHPIKTTLWDKIGNAM